MKELAKGSQVLASVDPVPSERLQLTYIHERGKGAGDSEPSAQPWAFQSFMVMTMHIIWAPIEFLPPSPSLLTKCSPKSSDINRRQLKWLCFVSLKRQLQRSPARPPAAPQPRAGPIFTSPFVKEKP